MRKFTLAATLLMAMLLTACGGEAPESAAPEAEPIEFLFVHYADSLALQSNVLTLEGVADEILYFSDRPYRIMGRMPIEEFLANWDAGENSFASVPPNAVISSKKGDEIADAVMVLKDPVLNGRQLVYQVDVLDGPASGVAGTNALFIDGFLPPPGGKPGFLNPPGDGRDRDRGFLPPPGGRPNFLGRGEKSGGRDRDNRRRIDRRDRDRGRR